MIGGLVSSTLLEFLVRPALFSSVGFRTARRLTAVPGENSELH